MSGETYETMLDKRFAEQVRRNTCTCGSRPALGDRVTIWSPDWKIGDLQIVKCPKCTTVQEQR